MSAVPKRKLTAAEYLAIERAAEFKSEFYAGEMFAMSGASPGHNRIKDNLIGLLAGALRGTGCYTLSSDQRVRVDAVGMYAYPDVVTVGSPAAFAGDDPDTLLNPRVVVEVLPAVVGRWNPWVKLRHYRHLPALAEYVLIDATEPVVTRYTPHAGGSWLTSSTAGPDAAFAFAAVPARVPLADLYAGVAFPPVPPR